MYDFLGSFRILLSVYVIKEVSQVLMIVLTLVFAYFFLFFNVDRPLVTHLKGP